MHGNRTLRRSILSSFTMALGLLAASRAPAQSAPAVTLSATVVTFGPQLANTTSPAQTVTLTNSGNAPLTFAGITLVGSFAQTNTCPTGSTPLAAGANCTLSITFNPIAGSNTPVPGLIEIMDNAAPIPQAITLVGTAQAFSLSASPSSARVSVGGSATYTISVAPLGGFNAAVSFSCSGLPAGASCSFSPASVTPNGSSAISSSLTISTTGSASAPGGRTPPGPPPGPNWLWTAWLAAALSILSAGLIAAWARKRRNGKLRSGFAAALVLATMLVAMLAVPGCGGGSSSSSGSSATPAGNYTVLVTGSTPAGSGTLTSPVSVTLNVQ
jgi:trimeric autotransporter adhesin